MHKLQSLKLEAFQEVTKKKDMFFFEKKNQKTFKELRKQIPRKLCCDTSQHITIFSRLQALRKSVICYLNT